MEKLTMTQSAQSTQGSLAKTKKGLEAQVAQLQAELAAAKQSAAVATPAPVVPVTTHPSLPAGAVISQLPATGFIADGVYFVSPAGTLCYKLPQVTFSQVLALSTPEALAKVASWPEDKLARALAWANARLADKGPDGKVYLILPVSKAKQIDSLSMYMRRLWAFKKAVQAAQTAQASDVLFASQLGEPSAF